MSSSPIQFAFSFKSFTDTVMLVVGMIMPLVLVMLLAMPSSDMMMTSLKRPPQEKTAH